MVTINVPPELRKIEQILFASVKQNRFDLVSRIIDGHKCDINVRDSFDRTPLHLAASSGNLPMVKLLIEGRALVDPVDKFGITPLFWAVYNNYKNVAHYLLNMGAKHNRVTKNGMTPFLIAASKGNELLMEILVKRNCNVNATDLDNSGCSPLHLACENNQQHCVRLLLETGANADIETETRDCPLIECSRRGFHKCIDLLIENKASREKTSKVGDTALHVAALSNLSDTIYFLFSRKFDLCVVKEDKQTPLHLAVSQNRLEAVEALLFCGAPLDLKDKDNQTPLMIAAKSNYTALVDMIIRADRWNKTYPVNAQKLIDEILQTQQTKYVTTRILDKKQKNTQEILSNDRKHLFNDNTGNHSNNKNNDSTEDSESSRTYVGQHHDYHHHHPTTTDIDENSIIPNDNDPNDVMMIEFIDPFKQLQLEENNKQINEIQLIVDHRSTTTASSESGSELSLGYEASRAWNRSDPRQYQSNHDLLNNSFSLSQISLSRDLTEPNFNQEHYDHDVDDVDDDDYHHRKHGSLNNLSCQVQGDEIYLPNGETIFRITDTLLAQSSKNSYKEHTYRLLNIWLHGISDNQSPLNELYLALTTIGRKRIVEQLRRRIKTLNKLNNKHKCKLY
uniref:Ankyrin repeat and death domain-containing protein 1B n=1 Tax=Schistosoma haematobium TaxID=6185 RepID=A0A094ZSW2_SCHHA